MLRKLSLILTALLFALIPLKELVHADSATNLVSNGSLENTQDLKTPDNWTTSNYGKNSALFTYLDNGHTGSRSVKTEVTSYTDGDAKWYFNQVAVTPSTQYAYSDYYKATTQTQVNAAFTMSDGSVLNQTIGMPDASEEWAQFTTHFSIPLGATSVSIYHLIHSVGSLTIDDVVIRPIVLSSFNRALVSLTFDDGFETSYSEVLPRLNKYGFVSTQYIVTGTIDTPGYMTKKQVIEYSKTNNEVASHTQTHTNMLTQTASEYATELLQSRAILESWIKKPVANFAYPNGLHNSAIDKETKKHYSVARGTESSLNSKNDFDPYNVRVQNIYSTTTTAQVADWVAQAKATNTWLILVYHAVRTPTSSTDIYSTSPANLDAQFAAIKKSGATVKTFGDAYEEIYSQINPGKTFVTPTMLDIKTAGSGINIHSFITKLPFLVIGLAIVSALTVGTYRKLKSRRKKSPNKKTKK